MCWIWTAENEQDYNTPPWFEWLNFIKGGPISSEKVCPSQRNTTDESEKTQRDRRRKSRGPTVEMCPRPTHSLKSLHRRTMRDVGAVEGRKTGRLEPLKWEGDLADYIFWSDLNGDNWGVVREPHVSREGRRRVGLGSTTRETGGVIET